MSRTDEAQSMCTTIVRELMADYDWCLLSEDVFTEAVLERIPPKQQIEPESLRKWGINTYCRQALYPACLGTQGQAKRARGFEELAAYLYPLASRAWPQVADDATQEALVVIYDTVADCRNPGAFLAFAIQKLRDAARGWIKKDTKEDSLDAWREQDFYGDVTADAGIVVADEVGVEEATLYSDLRREVADRIKAVRQQNPRAHRQLEAVWLRYFKELSNGEIASALDTTPENVSVLIHRGLEKLRQDEPLWELAEEISGQSEAR